MRSRSRTLVPIAAILGALSTGFVLPNYHAQKRTRGVQVTVKDSGQTYDLINTITCLTWPSEEAKTLGGRNAWNGWWPENGTQGTAIAKAPHCFSPVNVVFVKFDKFYAPIGENGLTFLSGSIDDLPALPKSSGP